MTVARSRLQARLDADIAAARDPVVAACRRAERAALLARLVAAGLWLSAMQAARTARPLDTLAAAIAADKRDFAARHERAQVLFAKGEFTAAMDELLEIVMRDKGWNDGLARKTYVAILEIMAKPAPKADPAAPKQGTLEVAGKMATTSADPVIDGYRRKLSMALF